MKTPILTFLALLTFQILLFSQSDNSTVDLPQHCLSDELHQLQLSQNPNYAQKHQAFEQQMLELQQNTSGNETEMVTGEVIPVVIHIIHQNGEENITDAQALQAMQYLNDAFANVGDYDPSTGVDVGIEFCLAVRDPDGNATTGINRIESSLTEVTAELQDLDLKGLIQWDPLSYLNIWVVQEVISLSAGSNVAGYAFLPASHGGAEDGIVVEAAYFGSNPVNSKVTIHEAGHYLGLYHTFQGGCANNNCLTDGDRVCDTPPDQSTAATTCGTGINTCDTDEDDPSTNNPFRSIALGGLGDQEDMITNYMDYGFKECKTAYTQGQSDRMLDALTTTRQSLLTSNGCVSPCLLPSFAASFTTSSGTTVNAGELITFMNTTGPATGFEWSIDNTFLTNDTDANYTFNQEGIYNVSLTATDDASFCLSTTTLEIEVLCPGDASFDVSNTTILPGQTIDFNNTSTGALSYEWYLDGILYSTNVNESINFPVPGFYTMYLIATTAACNNVSTTITLRVGDCQEDRSRMNWHFGNQAALDFNSGFPVPVLTSAIECSEGTSSISDENGDLLFYTNGLSVWDKSNNIMPNGDGLLGGSFCSSRNQVIIVPSPGNPDQYYVFTNDEAENAFNTGLHYSIVDMSLNGGLGDVTADKNVFLWVTEQESIAAVYHPNGNDAWFILPIRFPASMYAFHIDENGINPPVITSMFPRVNPALPVFFSSGKKVVLSRASPPPVNVYLTVMDFDGETGVFDNPLEIVLPGGSGFSGLELSPDDSKLYGVRSGILYQWDLSLTTAQAIMDSEISLGAIASGGATQMLLAPDDKIYISRPFDTEISVINNPNVAGVDCGLSEGIVSLGGQESRIGLPIYTRGTRYSGGVSIEGPEETCLGSPTEIRVNTPDTSCTYTWYVDDVLIPTPVTDTLLSLVSTELGAKEIKVIEACNCGVAMNTITLLVSEPGDFDLGPDQSICISESVVLNAGSDFATYLWQDGSTNETLTVNSTSTNWVQVTDALACIYIDTVLVNVDASAPIVNLGPDQTLCEGQVAVFDANTSAETYEWQDDWAEQSYTAWLPGTYWVTAANGCGASTDTISLLIDTLDLVDLGDDISLCIFVDEITLNAGSGGDFYVWQDSSSNMTYTVTEPGTYWVEVATQAGCGERDSIIITIDNIAPVIECPEDIITGAPSGQPTLFVDPGTPSAMDDCLVTFINDFNNTSDASDDYPVGITTILWTVSDEAGNMTTCSMEVNIGEIESANSVGEWSPFTIYPNPGPGLFTLENDKRVTGGIRFKVVNALGIMVIEEGEWASEKMLLDLSEMTSGVYYLVWHTEEERGVRKLIVF